MSSKYKDADKTPAYTPASVYKVAVSLARAATSPLECFSSMALAIVTETNKPPAWVAAGNIPNHTATGLGGKGKTQT